MWPFRKREKSPRVLKRLEELELRSTDMEDSMEKLLHQQHRIIAKVNARHRMAIKELEDADDIPSLPQSNDQLPMFADPKAELRARARQLRER